MRRPPATSSFAYSFGPGPLTPAIKAIVLANVAMFVANWFATRTLGISLNDVLGLRPVAVIGGLQVWQLVTYMFLHGGILHIAFNMLALWWIGGPVEMYLGRARYIGLYFVSGLAGGAGAVLQAPFQPVVGASGAIFGILGAMLIIEWQVTGRLAGNAATWIVINLAISFAIPNISWGGHVGGLIGGILITLAYAEWRRGRAQYGSLNLAGIVGLVVVAAGSVALAYFKVRGYA